MDPVKRPVRPHGGPRYTFLHSAHPDDAKSRSSQASIRRHVADQVGRSRRKKPRHTIIPLNIRTSAVVDEDGHSLASQSRVPNEVPPLDEVRLLARSFHSQPPWSLNPQGILGVDLDQQALEVIHFIKADAENSRSAFHTIWVPMGFSDSCALYLMIANAILVRNGRQKIPPGRQTYSADAARYYSEAVRELSRRLSTRTECTSTGVILSIVGCLCHDVHIGEWDRWAVHISGLERVISLRGGTDGLGGPIPTILFWLDLVGSAVHDSIPRFPIPKEVTATSIIPEEVPSELQALIHETVAACPQLSLHARALAMLSGVAQTVNRYENSKRFWQDTIGAVSLLGPSTHYLLSIPRLTNISDETPQSLVVGELLRLVCLTILSRLKGMFSLNTLDMMPLLWKLVAVLPRLNEESHAEHLADLILWSLITFAIFYPGEHIKALHTSIRAAVDSKGMSTTDETMRFVRKLIWFDVLERDGELQLAEDIFP